MATRTKKRRKETPPAREKLPPPSAPPVPQPIWPLPACVGALWAALIIVLVISLGRNEGHFSYALDDAFIHMAIAKNIMRHGVWGVTPYEFASASSSYLWTLLLSFVYLVSGVRDLTPFILNALFGTLLVGAGYYVLKAYRLPPWYLAIVLITAVFAMPLVPLIFSGMEHVLHALLVVLFAGLASRELARETAPPPMRALRWLYLLVPFVVLARFESLALVAAVVMLFLLRRRWRDALIIAALAALVVIVPGLISMKYAVVSLPNSLDHRRLFLPVSVMAKLQVPLIPHSAEEMAILFKHGVMQVVSVSYLGLALLLGVFIMIGRAVKGARFWEERQLLLILALVAVLFHAVYGRVGWLMRYEAYVVVLSVFALLAGAYDLFAVPREEWTRLTVARRRVLAATWGVAVILGVACVLPITLPHPEMPDYQYRTLTEKDRQQYREYVYQMYGMANLYYRVVIAHRNIAVQTTNIYQQQVQMGRFLHQYYDAESVVANDIGAITYYTKIRLLDLEGLGSMQFLPYRLAAGQFTPEHIRLFADRTNARIAVVYDTWYRNPQKLNVLPNWVAVGQWTIPDNRICGGDTVTFYAVDPTEAPALAANLREFNSSLPRGVQSAVDSNL